MVRNNAVSGFKVGLAHEDLLQVANLVLCCQESCFCLRSFLLGSLTLQFRQGQGLLVVAQLVEEVVRVGAGLLDLTLVVFTE